MTKVRFKGPIQSFRGKMDGLIFRQLPDGTTVVTKAPPKKNKRQKKRAKEKRSPAQKAHNDRFSNSSEWAWWASRENPVYARLADADPMRNAYNFAISDWFKPPEIHRVVRRGKHIRVEATDNIQVARVRVTVQDENGRVLEKGECTKAKGNWWTFTPTVKGHTIIAEAWDMPKNVAKFVLE